MDRHTVFTLALQLLGTQEYKEDSPTQHPCDVWYNPVLRLACARFNWTFTARETALKRKRDAQVAPGSGTIGGITGGIQAYNEAKKHNAQAAEFNASQEVQGGLMKPMEMKNLTGSSVMGALDGADAWSSATNAMNPYMSSFTTQGWEKSFLKSLGYGQR